MIRIIYLFYCLSLFYSSHSVIGLQIVKQDTALVDEYISIARAYQTSSADSVIKYAKNGLELAENINYNKGIAYSYWALGIGQRMSARYDYSLLSFKSGLELSKNINDQDLVGELSMGLGGVYYYQHKLDSAMKYFLSASEIFIKNRKKDRLAAASVNLGLIFSEMGVKDKALNYFNQSLKYAEDEGLLNIQLPAMINLAAYYENVGNYDSAIYYADVVYQKSKKNDLQYGVSRALLLLPRIYVQEELYNEALRASREGLALFTTMGDKRKLLIMTYQEALALKGLSRYREALARCEQFLQTAETMEGIFMEDIYLLLTDLHSTMGNPRKALEYHQLFFEAYKNAAVEKQQSELLELEAKYETEKKNLEIASLTVEASLKEVKIQQQRLIIAMAIILFVVIVTILILFFRQRNLNKQNELLSLEQRFLRSQMNPHFIFNALGAIQKFIIKNDPMQSATFISKFSSLMRKVLEHSREEFVSLAEELESLKNYLDLQKLRFENRFNYSIEVEADLNQKEITIPPMFAQPFIENALEHGLLGVENGKIEIQLKKIGKQIQLMIKDNGKGFSDQSHSDNHKSLATTITKERIQRLNAIGMQAEFNVENTLNEQSEPIGVMVSLNLPYKS